MERLREWSKTFPAGSFYIKLLFLTIEKIDAVSVFINANVEVCKNDSDNCGLQLQLFM